MRITQECILVLTNVKGFYGPEGLKYLYSRDQGFFIAILYSMVAVSPICSACMCIYLYIFIYQRCLYIFLEVFRFFGF